MQYYVTGANEVTGTIDGQYAEIETADSTSITITTDGKSVVYARTVDNAGNKSDVKQTDAWKDAVPPPAVNLTFVSKTENSVTVNTSGGGTDATSGIAKYVFEYKESTASSWTTSIEQTSLPSSYEYTGLTAGTTYNFRVRIIDNAGNESTGTGVTETPEIEVPVPMEAYLDFTNIGKSIDYKPKTGQSFNCVRTINGTSTDLSGTSGGTYRTSDYDGNWVIWGEDDGAIYITTATVITGNLFKLSGILGYVNRRRFTR